MHTFLVYQAVTTLTIGIIIFRCAVLGLGVAWYAFFKDFAITLMVSEMLNKLPSLSEFIVPAKSGCFGMSVAIKVPNIYEALLLSLFF